MSCKKVFVSLLFLSSCSFAYSQTNVYGLKVISSPAEYKAAVDSNPNSQLVELIKYIPDLKLDIRYATKNNFAGIQVYDEAKAFARFPVAIALQSVQKELREKGLGLKIYDAYRPYSVTVKFFEVASDKNFVASPKTGSRHNRGCAIDLTIVRLRNGRELRMPTPYDSFAPEASPEFSELPNKVKANRDLLIRVMENNGFKVLHNEWWHFDYKDWKQFDLMDVPFNQL